VPLLLCILVYFGWRTIFVLGIVVLLFFGWVFFIGLDSFCYYSTTDLQNTGYTSSLFCILFDEILALAECDSCLFSELFRRGSLGLLAWIYVAR